jgi:hypothetical protein
MVNVLPNLEIPYKAKKLVFAYWANAVILGCTERVNSSTPPPHPTTPIVLHHLLHRVLLIGNDEYDLQIRTDKLEYTDWKSVTNIVINSQNTGVVFERISI